MAPTRAYPIPPLTPLLAMNRNAVSSVAELGVPAMTRFMEFWRLRSRCVSLTASASSGSRPRTMTWS